MDASSGSVDYDEYLRLTREYQKSITRSFEALDNLRRAQQELRDHAGTIRFDTKRIDAATQVATALNQIVGSTPDSDGVLLSPREQDVFNAIGDGLSSQDIAAKLGVAISTVETYRERLKTKLKLSNGVALTRSAILKSLSRNGHNGQPPKENP